MYQNGSGEITDNRIDGNARSGIGVHSGSHPNIRNNTITASGQSGLYFSEYAGGIAENNIISRSAMAGVSIKHGAKPTIRNNDITDGQSAGIYVRGLAGGIIEGNRILRSAKVGIGIKHHAFPRIVGNRIEGGQAGGICVHRSASGVIQGNLIGAHPMEALCVKVGSLAMVADNASLPATSAIREDAQSTSPGTSTSPDDRLPPRVGHRT